ncbi:YdeI/OmpD-associated family protein [Acetobacteroides hydrogenigenes]|uniref:Bacteriocin resistance YdeI/OmpD-like protein n=1 Tax=Acetobacteroides hydrogenigenes TaxID=979970 RepID=A0A4R2ENC3_9BACT|nr:YdeI/OmpD-associated family protein [Acetobacteroides hydrogenigenes]TCN68946.1 bacteriocin resistance YdeI/OmpD-like protein [Acetobacteroides hydrogenigenes]
MMEKGNHIEGVPQELQRLLDVDKDAQDFFNSLSKSYKQGYCDWVGSAKQEATRQTRAEKAILMLRNNQKTLKTVKY